MNFYLAWVIYFLINIALIAIVFIAIGLTEKYIIGRGK